MKKRDYSLTVLLGIMAGLANVLWAGLSGLVWATIGVLIVMIIEICAVKDHKKGALMHIVASLVFWLGTKLLMGNSFGETYVFDVEYQPGVIYPEESSAIWWYILYGILAVRIFIIAPIFLLVKGKN